MNDQEQPAPKPNHHPAIWELVVADMQARDKVGERRYGTRLQPFNGRNAIRDLYEELLDAVVYARQLMYELDAHSVDILGMAKQLTRVLMSIEAALPDSDPVKARLRLQLADLGTYINALAPHPPPGG